jgi:hypothetical protein
VGVVGGAFGDLEHGSSSCSNDVSATGPDSLTNTPIPIADDGWIDAASNPLGIQGWVYAKDDCEAATSAGLNCAQRDSSLIGPDGKQGWSIEDGSVCVKGVAEQVSDPAVQWGFEVGITLNQTRDGVPMAYDASKLKGFAAQIRGILPEDLRFEVQMNDGDDEYVTMVRVPSDATVRFSTLTHSASAENPFDPARITSIALHPMPSSFAPVYYAFCLTSFGALE